MVVRLRYYNLALIGRKSPILSYCCDTSLEKGEVVSVPLKNSLVSAVVLHECEKPSFETKPVFERLFTCLTPLQQNLAYFIASYYLCSLGESLQLFVPIASSLAFLPQ
ncbi:MAG: primosomal protein N', partial [Helicobacter sp.]|nr:primosomal protein N' [Helicobacter sp.]